MYLFCINKLLLLGVQEFVYRWMTPCMHTKWFYKCWLESGRAKQCPWADSADSTAGWAEQPPGLCILRKYQEGCLGGASPAAETVVSSGLCQVHIVLHKGEKAVFMCPQFLHLFAALLFHFGHLMAAFKFCDVNCGFVTSMYSFGQHF